MDITEIKKLIENFKVEKQELGEIINPIISKFKLEQKEVIEVCQIGKFIYKLNDNILIYDKPRPPKPDFIIKKNSELIGLEHTRIFTETSEKYNKVVSIFNYAENIYKKLYPNELIFASISLRNDEINIRQNQKKQIATEIAEYIFSLKNNVNCKKPFYIEEIRLQKHSKISFSYKEKNWEAPFLTKERLRQEIIKKENKIPLYKKQENELKEYWLVLLIGSLSSVSYQLDEYENYKTESLFDRVYLMDDFNAKIIQVK